MLVPGQAAECTIVNTKVVKRIDMLNRYGLIIMISVMLGAGLAAVRRSAPLSTGVGIGSRHQRSQTALENGPPFAQSLYTQKGYRAETSRDSQVAVLCLPCRKRSARFEISDEAAMETF
jgi:hypothetical protein